jgi:plastocyanin
MGNHCPRGWREASADRGTVNRRLVHRAALPGVVASLALGFGLAACAGSGSSDAASTATLGPVQSGAATVTAEDNNFVPQQLTVTEGTEVTFTNDGRNQHNVIAVESTPFSVETASFEPGESFAWKASVPGTYRYYCSIHGTATAGMTGTIQVVAP